MFYVDIDTFDFWGNHISIPNKKLIKINAYQEFWHSWKTFHPQSRIY